MAHAAHERVPRAQPLALHSVLRCRFRADAKQGEVAALSHKVQRCEEGADADEEDHSSCGGRAVTEDNPSREEREGAVCRQRAGAIQGAGTSLLAAPAATLSATSVWYADIMAVVGVICALSHRGSVSQM